MSFQEEKRERIKRYILEKIREDDTEYLKKTMDNFQISITTVKRYIKECLELEVLREEMDSVCGYQLVSKEVKYEFNTKERLAEDKIFFEKVRTELPELSKEAANIWSYSFTEMMNNAIEHSDASRILCTLKKDALYTEISIVDDGQGIFHKIRKYLEERGISADNQDVLAELYKGKLTTAVESHSGEGIFFTSKLLKAFEIWSDSCVFTAGGYEKERLIQSHLIAYYTRVSSIGTMVVMKLENQTKRSIREVFDVYAPVKEGFVNTVIPLKDVCLYGEPVARSQARRIVYRLEEFKHVVFDCADIEFMGQGFADEIFRVFQTRHPEVELVVTNANESVAGMIQHAKATLENSSSM